jgi:hypothetical protein
MAKEMLKSLEGSGQRWTKQVRILHRRSSLLGNHVQVTNKGHILFSLVCQRRRLLPLLQNLYPFVSVLMSGNGRKWVEIRVKTLPWSVWFNILKGNLMETMELTPNKLKSLCEVDLTAFCVE